MEIKVTGFYMGHDEMGEYGPYFASGHPDSAGGVSVIGKIHYSGKKTIKYITLKFTPYNRVNDAVGCDVKNVSEFGLKCTGPIEPGSSQEFKGENLWYNYSITSVKVTGADMQYMDGTEQHIPGNEITVEAGRCYVATAVYGSYDCPQVWMLRRYRDYTLSETWYGRAFIRTYYAISPICIKYFGNTAWFRKTIKRSLDIIISKLRANGVQDTPYKDKNW